MLPNGAPPPFIEDGRLPACGRSVSHSTRLSSAVPMIERVGVTTCLRGRHWTLLMEPRWATTPSYTACMPARQGGTWLLVEWPTACGGFG